MKLVQLTCHWHEQLGLLVCVCDSTSSVSYNRPAHHPGIVKAATGSTIHWNEAYNSVILVGWKSVKTMGIGVVDVEYKNAILSKRYN